MENTIGFIILEFADTNLNQDQEHWALLNRSLFEECYLTMSKKYSLPLHVKRVFARPDGAKIQDDEYLFQSGAWVFLVILTETGETNIEGYFQIDTAAHRSMILGDVVDLAGIAVREKLENISNIHGNKEVQKAPFVKVIVPELELKLILQDVTVLRDQAERNWTKAYGPNYIGIVGRDLLSQCKLVYDGPNGIASLERIDETVKIDDGSA